MINNDYERLQKYDDKRLSKAIFTASWVCSAMVCGGFVYLIFAVR
jgi:hypothetical protein